MESRVEQSRSVSYPLKGLRGEARLPAVAGVSGADPVRLQNQQARYTSGARKALSLANFCWAQRVRLVRADIWL